MNLKETIFKLTSLNGSPGFEISAAKDILEMLNEYTQFCYIKNGSVIGHLGDFDENKKHILIDAHLDKIGFVVTFITDDGFIKVSNCGGVDKRILSGQQVIILGEKKITGIVCSIPPHLADDTAEIPKIDDIFIDIGLTKKQAEEVINLGNSVLFDTNPATSIGDKDGDKITASGLDDRAGIAAILKALDILKDQNLGNITVLFSASEEIGSRGAKTCVYDINPDIAIAVDVSFALSPDEPKLKCGKLGGGVMIGVSPALDGELSKELKAIAVSKNIPYQIEVMNGKTGTNADMFSINKGGVKTALLSIPLRYMHTPVEVISIKDVEATALLLAEFLKKGGETL